MRRHLSVITRLLSPRALLRPALCLASLLLLSSLCPAQNGPAGPVIIVNRGYWGEIALVVLFAGAALYAVCRSSRRA